MVVVASLGKEPLRGIGAKFFEDDDVQFLPFSPKQDTFAPGESVETLRPWFGPSASARQTHLRWRKSSLEAASMTHAATGRRERPGVWNRDHRWVERAAPLSRVGEMAMEERRPCGC